MKVPMAFYDSTGRKRQTSKKSRRKTYLPLSLSLMIDQEKTRI